jgi:hypothetical protein
MLYSSIEIITSISMPFSAASFRARGDAITRPSLVELLVVVVVVVVFFSFIGGDAVGCSGLLVGSSFLVSFFSVFTDEGVCSSEDFFFADAASLPSSL